LVEDKAMRQWPRRRADTFEGARCRQAVSSSLAWDRLGGNQLGAR
jgi:hypothetical protein